MIKAFIFDLDGTLIDSEHLWCKALQRVAESHGLAMSEPYACELVLGKAWSDIVGRLRRDYPAIEGDDAAIERESLVHYEALRGTMDIRIHSSIKLLERLAQSHPVVIVSGSTRRQVDDAIAMMGIGRLLQFYLGSEDYPRGKPDPMCFLLAARRLNVKPAECLVFEDSTAGVCAARAAGMHCVALRVRSHPHQDLSAAHVVLADLADFEPRSDKLFCGT